MPPRTRRRASIDPALVATFLGALAATAVLIGPAMRPGFALYLDHITVPHPSPPRWHELTTPDALRAWPLSGASWVWSQALPSWTFQHATLLVAVLGAGLGAGLVLRRWGWVAALAASILAIANPYVVERLLLGQAGLLLGYAALPWIVLASRQASPGRRVGWTSVASVPAALTPWGSVVVGVCAVGAALVRRRGVGEVALQTLASAALCLPWLVPVMFMPHGPADPEGAVAFRLADDTGLGTLGSAILGGGVWSEAAHLSARDGALGMTFGVAVIVLAALGVRSLTVARPGVGSVVTLAWLGIPLVAAVLSGPALGLWADLQTAPGVALFRDLHRLLAPSAMALVLLGAVGMQRLVTMTTQGQRAAGAVLGVGLPAALAVMFVPGSAARLHSAYEPAPFSSEWRAAVDVTESPGRVLTLPWQPLRRSEWMPNTFLDPTGKALGGRTLGDTTLTVVRDGRTVVVNDDRDVEAVDVTLVRRLTAQRTPVPSELLMSSGIAHILIWRDSPGSVPGRPDGWTVTFSGADFEVWSSEGAASR